MGAKEVPPKLVVAVESRRGRWSDMRHVIFERWGGDGTLLKWQWIANALSYC